MKIRVRPEDFVVREQVDLRVSSEGRYGVYLLHKRGWNTLDAIGAIARASGVPVEEIRYAGLKDRYSLSTQYISVPRSMNLRESLPEVAGSDLRVQHIGYSDDFVSTRNLIGNEFSVTVRSLDADEAALLRARIALVSQSGFPNYFDDQRFGSVPAGGELLGERVVKGHLKGALRLYMTAEYPAMKAGEKERKRSISASWGDWNVVYALCRDVVERRIVEALMKGGNKKNLLAAINAIPGDEMTMYFAAFQASVWNETLRDIIGARLRSAARPVMAADTSSASGQFAQRDATSADQPGQPGTASTLLVPGREAPYVIPVGEESAAILEALRGVRIPTVAHKTLPADPEVETAIAAVLSARGIARSDLNIRGVHNAYLKSFYRDAVVVPGDLESDGTGPDDLYRGRLKTTLRFSLPRGSYATMLLKALTGRAGEREPVTPSDSADPGAPPDPAAKPDPVAPEAS